ncbi:phage tail protein [Lewinella sp. LCG006]|uniref:phage tail protein n=1 Tax=Lewinella sp. LCG006 TaxID=3231911 RepID=UPI00346055D9
MAQEGFIGEIRMFAGNFAPRSWALCEGQLLPIAQNTALFSILGTIYGGDGRTTFALPDLRGRLPISSGTGPGLPTYREGQKGGQPTHTLTQAEMPNHTHTPTAAITGTFGVATNTETSNSGEGSGNVLGEAAANIYNNQPADPAELLGGVVNTLGVNLQLQNTGGSQSHENQMPYLAVNYIIALYGVFPSRN